MKLIDGGIGRVVGVGDVLGTLGAVSTPGLRSPDTFCGKILDFEKMIYFFFSIYMEL